MMILRSRIAATVVIITGLTLAASFSSAKTTASRLSLPASTAQDMVLDFGGVRVGEADTLIARITNSADATAPLIIYSYTISGAYAHYFSLIGPLSPPDTIGIGDSLNIRVRFCPGEKSHMIAYLQLQTNAQATPVQITLLGAGLKGILIGDQLNFGLVRIGDCKSGLLRLTNIGDLDVSICGFAFLGGGAADYSSTGVLQGSTIAAHGGILVIGVDFCPTTVGGRNVQIRIITCPASDTLSVAVLGKGTGSLALQSESSTAFGSVLVRDTVRNSLLVRNISNSAMTLIGASISGSSDFHTTSSLSLPVDNQKTVSVDVWYSPMGVGADSATITIMTDVGLGLSAVLRGTGVASTLSVEPQFISIHQSSPSIELRSVVLHCPSNRARRVDSLQLLGSPAWWIYYPLSWPFSIPSLASDSVLLRFSPQGSGNYGALLNIFMDDGTVYPIALSGDVSPTEIDDPAGVPGTLILSPLHPNPFSASASFEYSLPTSVSASVIVRDLLGRILLVQPQGMRDAGRHTTVVDAATLSAGTYLLQLCAGADSKIQLVGIIK